MRNKNTPYGVNLYESSWFAFRSKTDVRALLLQVVGRQTACHSHLHYSTGCQA